MKRRDFLQRAATLVALGVAADQIELLECLGPRPKLWSGYRTPHIAYELQLLNSFSLGYVVPGRDWRFNPDGFAHAARLSGRDVRYELARDAYFVSERTKQPWVFAPVVETRRVANHSPPGWKLSR